MEVCSKGLGFWTYQVTQEVVYQEYLAKSLTERSNTLSGQLDKIIRDANSEIASLRDKIAAMTIAEEELRRKNHELMEGWREKGRKLAQTQELYDKLKRRTLISQVRNAASENVNQAILMSAQQSASTHHPPHLQDLAAAHHTQQRPQNRRQRHDGQPDFIMTGARIGNVSGGMQPRSAESSVCSDQGGGISMAPPLRQTQRYKASRRNEGGGFNEPEGTPMRSQEHRQRLMPTLGMSSQVVNGYQGDNLSTALRRSKRPPLDGISGNMRAGGDLRFGSNLGLKGNLQVRGEY
ncbi:uncharacterized protein LAJ45_05313 [Morchella importuna]|uniref:uncharacterized protein n=1 Tax=Morchella importuna TaxID=1174673 RepID=UPI001E8EBB0E|nr:uncharacterized protein LAJ45_05313 [Morchella importuna]KAH8150617.1 hypothetical protein LAJ45_05313 [Morchella importuna]